MKKLLLLSAFLLALNMQAQDFWTQYATNQSAASTGIRSISIVDANTTWLNLSCGTANCTAIRRYALSTNGGTVWSTGIVDFGATSANLTISNIVGVSPTVAYAAAFGTAGAVGGIWKTADAGVTWNKQATATFNDGASFPDAVYFWNANDGVAVGDPDVGGYFEIYTTGDGGTNWTRVASSTPLVAVDPLEYGLTNKFTVQGNNIWVGTTFGRILKSADKGVTWTATQSPIPDFGGGINGSQSGNLAFTDGNNGLLQTNDFFLWSTADGGTTWTSILEDSTTLLRDFGIAAIPGLVNTYVSVGEDLTNTVRGSSYSVDGGITWVDINDNPDLSYVQGGVVAFFDQNTGFASGFSSSATVGGIYKWNGNTLAVSTFANDKSFTATPNPISTGMLTVAGKGISQVVVYDVIGKQVSSTTYSSLNNVELNFSSLNTGVYMVKVTNDLGNTSTIKVIKK